MKTTLYATEVLKLGMVPAAEACGAISVLEPIHGLQCGYIETHHSAQSKVGHYKVRYTYEKEQKISGEQQKYS